MFDLAKKNLSNFHQAFRINNNKLHERTILRKIGLDSEFLFHEKLQNKKKRNQEPPINLRFIVKKIIVHDPNIATYCQYLRRN